VHDADADRILGLPGIVTAALLLLAYLLPGLVGHDPGRPRMRSASASCTRCWSTDQWLIPHLAGEPFLEDGPLYYWIAALTAKLSGLVLAPHDGHGSRVAC